MNKMTDACFYLLQVYATCGIIISNVVPIPKRKSNVPTPADFRPISLLPILSKMLD